MNLSVRTILPSDRLAFYKLASAAFIPNEEPEDVALAWDTYYQEHPDYHSKRFLGVYEGDSLLGGCIVHERRLRCGESSILSGCVGAVVTHPEQRQRGLGRALMDSVIRLGLEKEYGLLFLDGIRGYYHRWDYVDVLDLTDGELKIEEIQKLPDSPYHLREATVADAAAVLALYNKHNARYVGSFMWTEDHMRHRIKYRSEDEFCLLAINDDDDALGYLFLSRQNRQRATEVVASDRFAAFTLLKEHALRYAETSESKETFCWPFAPQALLLYHISDQIEVRCETYFVPNGYWMARPAHLPTLFQSLLPAWQRRWRDSLASWSGEMTLMVEDATCHLRLTPGDVQKIEQAAAPANTIKLTSGAFVQLIFGYRPLSWYAEQTEQVIPTQLITVLDILFPTGNAYIPGTDHF